MYNDAPAPVQADIGIVIGAGTGVAVESADIVLVKSEPGDVAAVIDLSKKTYRKMVENLIRATGYDIVAIPLAAGVLFGVSIVLTPAAGVVLMSASTVTIAVNARMLRVRGQSPSGQQSDRSIPAPAGHAGTSMPSG